MKIKATDIALIVLVVLIIVVVMMGCIGCKEGFLSQFGDQITDPFLVDYANMPEFSDPARARWEAPKRQVPVSESTSDHQYQGLSGLLQRPELDFGYS